MNPVPENGYHWCFSMMLRDGWSWFDHGFPDAKPMVDDSEWLIAGRNSVSCSLIVIVSSWLMMVAKDNYCSLMAHDG